MWVEEGQQIGNVRRERLAVVTRAPTQRSTGHHMGRDGVAYRAEEFRNGRIKNWQRNLHTFAFVTPRRSP